MKNHWIIDREYLEEHFGIVDKQIQTEILHQIAMMDISMHEKHDWIEEHFHY